MTTPMRSQYLAIKKQYPDVIVFFRLGDFYETFDDDAKLVSEVCDVVLTSRPVGLDQRVPLAGVPYHAVEVYVAKLINAGYKVAIAEQIGSEPPKGEKLVPRVVRRVVTPGTLVEPGLLSEKRNNYLAALVLDGLGADRSAAGAPPALAWPMPTSPPASSPPRRSAMALIPPMSSTASRRSWRASRPPSSSTRRRTRAGPDRSPDVESAIRNPQSRNPPHPLRGLALRRDHRPAGAPDALRGGVAGRLRLRRQAGGDPGGGRAAAIPSGDAAGQHRPDRQPADVQHRRVHDAGRSHAPQPGADREHPRRHGAGLAARRAGCDPHPDGRAPAAPLAGAAAAERRCAQSAPRRRGGLAWRRAAARRAAPTPARPRRPGAVDEPRRAGHRPPA